MKQTFSILTAVCDARDLLLNPVFFFVFSSCDFVEKHFYVPVTRVCVTVISSGVPVGAQMAWLSMSSTG